MLRTLKVIVFNFSKVTATKYIDIVVLSSDSIHYNVIVTTSKCNSYVNLICFSGQYFMCYSVVKYVPQSMLRSTPTMNNVN